MHYSATSHPSFAFSSLQEFKASASELPPNNLETKIIQLVAEHAEVSGRALFHPTRCMAKVAEARQLAMYMLHVCGGLTLSEVARLFGRDRTTASHACHCVEDRRDRRAFDEALNTLEAKITKLIEADRAGVENVGR